MTNRESVNPFALVVAMLFLAVPAGSSMYRHAIHVEMDLSPLARYADTESYTALFERVRQKDPDPERFTFIALGDTRSNFELATKILLRAADENPAFILSNGDLGLEATVEEYLQYHIPLIRRIPDVPFIPAPGNHEKGPNYDFAAFKALYGHERFSFDYGGCRFIGVNNGDRPKMGPLDMRYLRRELAKPGVKHKFVILHQPPEFVEEAVHTTDVRGFSWNSRAFHRLMVEHEVDQVFVGHIHAFASIVRDGVRYTITGGGGVKLSGILGKTASVHHFVVIRVSPDGIETEVMKLMGHNWVRETLGSAAHTG